MTRVLLFGLLVLLLSGASLVLANNGGNADILGLTPPMGWNTWCTLGKCGRDYCDSKEIKSVANAMVKNGMKDAGWEYINLDDCWADHRDEKGEIVPDASRFPEGMKPMIAELNAKGFKFGLYTDGGMYTCSKGGRSHLIPGSNGHYEQDAKTYASWGVEYVKMDWCNSKVNGTPLDPHVIYRTMSDALKNTHTPIFFGACEWGVDNPWVWMSGIANSWRTGSDHHDDWASTAAIIEHNAELGKYAGPGGWNDPDFLMTGGQGCDPPVDMVHCPGQTDTEYRTEFSLWCIMAAPLLVATDVRNMTDIMKEILLNQDMIAVSQDRLGKAGGRLGYGTNCTESATACQIWGRDLHDGSVAIALYNSGSKYNTITFDFKIIGPGWTSPVDMVDLWTHKDVGLHYDSYSVGVESHGVEVYRVSRASRE